MSVLEPAWIKIETPRGKIEAIFNAVADARGAMVMVGGAGGGLHGPAGTYQELALRLQERGFASLRVNYRTPNNLQECIYDALAAIASLSEEGIDRIVLLGWSFGGAVVISAGAASDLALGVATVASQTYGAETVGELSPKSLLLIHGTADHVLPDSCSRDLYARAREPKQLVLYEGDDHGVTRHAGEMIETLLEWSSRVLAPAKAQMVSMR